MVNSQKLNDSLDKLIEVCLAEYKEGKKVTPEDWAAKITEFRNARDEWRYGERSSTVFAGGDRISYSDYNAYLNYIRSQEAAQAAREESNTLMHRSLNATRVRG